MRHLAIAGYVLRTLLVGLFVCILALVGCSSTSAGAGDTTCPGSAPNAGAKCARDGLQCEYGGDPRLSCDTVMVCSGAAWTVGQAPQTIACSTTSNPSACPATLGDLVQLSACGTTDAWCYYAGHARCFCSCRDDPGSASACMTLDGGIENRVWVCDTLDSAFSGTSCPAVRPRLGTACSSTDNCYYVGLDNSACWGEVLTCKGGVWTAELGAVGC